MYSIGTPTRFGGGKGLTTKDTPGAGETVVGGEIEFGGTEKEICWVSLGQPTMNSAADDGREGTASKQYSGALLCRKRDTRSVGGELLGEQADCSQRRNGPDK